MYAMVGVWVYGYPGDCQNALMLTSLTISVRFAVATFFVDFQIGVPAQSFLSLLETWFAWKRDPPSAHVSFLHQLTVSRRGEAHDWVQILGLGIVDCRIYCSWLMHGVWSLIA